MLHGLTNSEEYLYKNDSGKYGVLGEEAIELVTEATSLLQFISFEKCKQANLSVEWEMFCEYNDINFMPFQKSYAVRKRVINIVTKIISLSTFVTNICLHSNYNS